MEPGRPGRSPAACPALPDVTAPPPPVVPDTLVPSSDFSSDQRERYWASGAACPHASDHRRKNVEYFDKKDCVIFQSARTVAHLCKSRGCDLPLFKSLTVAPIALLSHPVAAGSNRLSTHLCPLSPTILIVMKQSSDSLLPNPTFIENTENQLAEAQLQFSRLRPGSAECGQPRSHTPSEKPALGGGCRPSRPNRGL